MPVYLATSHAYRSWREDNPKGYIQRDEGLKPPNERLAQWRAEHSNDEPAKFSKEIQHILHLVVAQIAAERKVRLHATATVTTHIHKLISFRSPACTCGTSELCWERCPARKHLERIITRMKQKMGQQIAQHESTTGRRWFSRGWDITPVRAQPHFDFLMQTYLPNHEKLQGGIFRAYK